MRLMIIGIVIVLLANRVEIGPGRDHQDCIIVEICYSRQENPEDMKSVSTQTPVKDCQLTMVLKT